MFQAERPADLEQAGGEQCEPARHGVALSGRWAAMRSPLSENVTVPSLQCSRDTHVTPRRAGFVRRRDAVAKLQCAGDIVIESLIRGADEDAADCPCGA